MFGNIGKTLGRIFKGQKNINPTQHLQAKAQERREEEKAIRGMGSGCLRKKSLLRRKKNTRKKIAYTSKRYNRLHA